MRFDVIVRSKKHKVKQLQAMRTQAGIDHFLRLAEHAERGIKAGVFYPNDNYTCGICGYADKCEKW